jgi:hypothetical protein
MPSHFDYFFLILLLFLIKALSFGLIFRYSQGTEILNKFKNKELEAKERTSSDKNAVPMQCQLLSPENISTQSKLKSCAMNPQKTMQSIPTLSEQQLLDFYRKLENEYGFRQPGFHGEQDWLEP